MHARRWLVAALVATRTVAADPAPDPEHAAVVAYKAKDYAAFLQAMRAVYARDPARPAVIYNLASAQALGGAPDEAIRTLRLLAATGLAFAIDQDADFAGLVARADFQAVVRTMARNRAPRGKAAAAFTLREPELLTEGVAYDPDGKTFFVSSVRHRKIVAIDAAGAQRDFIPEARDGVAGVMGMAVDRARHVLWASSAALPQMLGYRPEDHGRSALQAYELATGALIASYALPHDGKPHGLGDVIAAPDGDAYATDSASPTIYRVTHGKLEVVLDGPFRSLQGLAITPDGKTLYLADYELGLFALDLARKALTHLTAAPGLAVTGIDGLYLHRGRLVATQNGVEPRRVIELGLDAAGTRVVALRVVLSGNPRIRDLSLGVVVGDALYLNAAAGWEHYGEDGAAKAEPAAPHAILKLALPR